MQKVWKWVSDLIKFICSLSTEKHLWKDIEDRDLNKIIISTTNMLNPIMFAVEKFSIIRTKLQTMTKMEN